MTEAEHALALADYLDQALSSDGAAIGLTDALLAAKALRGFAQGQAGEPMASATLLVHASTDLATVH